MKQAASLAILLAAVTLPTEVLAYVGPGAGLSLLGALWALVAALATAFLFLLAWPVRRMLRRRRLAAAAQPAGELADSGGTPAAGPSGRES